MTVDILVGDCRELLRGLDAGSVNCCITSPPYFGLRDYGVEGQLGLETSPDEYVAEMVKVFREVHRVLRDDGTLWLNIGDSYARDAKKGQHKPGDSGKQAYVYDRGNGRASATLNLKSETEGSSDGFVGRADRAGVRNGALGLKPKDLIGIPWRVAFALQADGWYLRQDIIWEKPNCMPESVTDRCTKSHEYIFLFSKSERYYFDHLAIREPAACGAKGSSFTEGKTGVHQLGRAQKVRPSAKKGSFNGKIEAMSATGQNSFCAVVEYRNKRSVWSVPTKPFKGAHFATFPDTLITPCILAGSPVEGSVIDPFGGSGTVGMVAKRYERSAILCELNPEYAEMARARVDTEPGPVLSLEDLL